MCALAILLLLLAGCSALAANGPVPPPSQFVQMPTTCVVHSNKVTHIVTTNCWTPQTVVADLKVTAQPASYNLNLAWVACADPTVAGYNIYYGGRSGTYTNTIGVGNGTNATVTGLVFGVPYYFAAKSYNGQGVQSPFSNEVTNTVSGMTNVFALSFTNPSGSMAFRALNCLTNLQVKASTDLKSWQPIWSTNRTFKTNVPTIAVGGRVL